LREEVTPDRCFLGIIHCQSLAYARVWCLYVFGFSSLPLCLAPIYCASGLRCPYVPIPLALSCACLFLFHHTLRNVVFLQFVFFFPAYLCNKSCLFTKVSWTVPLFSRRSSLCFFWQACSLLSSPASVLFLHFSILCCTTTNLIEYYLACLTMSSEGKTVHFIKEKGRITVKNKCAYKLTCITSVLNRQGYQYQKVKKGEQE